jgi:hypothetical protein
MGRGHGAQRNAVNEMRTHSQSRVIVLLDYSVELPGSRGFADAYG